MNIKKTIVADAILGVCIPICLAVLLLSPIILKPGIPFYGDEVYYSKWYLPGFFSSQCDALYAWVDGIGPNSILTLIQYTVPLTIFELFVDHSVAVKLLMIIMACLPAISVYAAIRVLLGLESSFSSKSSFGQPAAFVGSLLMMLAFTNPGLTQWGASMVWAYALTPLSLAFFARFLQSGFWGDIVVVGVSTIIASAQPFGLILFFIVATLFFLLELVNTGRVLLIKRAIFALAIVLLLNSFWIVPMFSAYVLGAGGIFSTYTTEKTITFESLRFLSFWNLAEVLMVGEHSYFFFWEHPQNYCPLSVVAPILASLSIIKLRRKKHVLFVALTLVIGVFLTKGVNEPAGYLYYSVASNLPYGVGATLRNPTKFASLIIFSYSFLVGLSISYLSSRLAHIKLRSHVAASGRIRNFLRYGVVIGVTTLVLSPIAWGSFLHLQSYTWVRYEPTYIPEAYEQVYSWLEKQDDYYKVMWLGSGEGYVWKDAFPVSVFPELASPRPFVSSNYIWPDRLRSTKEIGKILSILGVKYLVLHSDSVGFPNDEAYDLLKSQGDLNLVQSFDLLVGLQREFQMKIIYTLPESVLGAGFKGEFGDGFNLRMAILPLSKEVALDRVWDEKMLESFSFNQQMVDDFEGNIYFEVAIAEYFEETGVRLYLNYYGGGFKSISPVYYLGTIRFEKSVMYFEPESEVEEYFDAAIVTQQVKSKIANIFVFENSNIVNQVYTSLQLPTDFDLCTEESAKLIRYERVSPVEWHIVVNASSPFFLVFAEPYDHLWRAYTNGKEIEPIDPFLVNAFHVEESGLLDIRVYYSLQDYFNLGYLMSSIAMIMLLFIMVSKKVALMVRRRRAAGGEPAAEVTVDSGVQCTRD